MKEHAQTYSQSNPAMKVSVISIFVNVGLSLFKILAGLVAHSGAMLSDGVHSISDVISTMIVMVGIKMAEKTPDEEHPYGHERFECVAAILLALLLALTGLGIGASAFAKILTSRTQPLVIPGAVALVAAIVSIIVKEVMYQVTKAVAVRTGSGALMADAWHHRSDALSSVASLIGIFGARMGAPALDPLAGIVIALFIVKAAYDIFKDGIDKMLDHACDPKISDSIRKTVLSVNGVHGIDLLKTRTFGNRIYVDLEISVDGTLTLKEAHDIAEWVHHSIEYEYPLVKHCMVHVNPA